MAVPMHDVLAGATERWPLLRRYARLIRFGIVGVSGVLVNTAVLWAMVRGLGLALLPASALATETAVVSNFLLNDRWTFRNAPRQFPFWQRLLRFNGVSLGGLVITAALLLLLTTYAHLSLVPANLLAVGGALAWNYIINTRWTWREPSREAAGSRSVGGGN